MLQDIAIMCELYSMLYDTTYGELLRPMDLHMSQARGINALHLTKYTVIKHDGINFHFHFHFHSR